MEYVEWSQKSPETVSDIINFKIFLEQHHHPSSTIRFPLLCKNSVNTVYGKTCEGEKTFTNLVALESPTSFLHEIWVRCTLAPMIHFGIPRKFSSQNDHLLPACESFLLHSTIIVLLPSQYFDNRHFCPFLKRGGACFWENMACRCAVHAAGGSFHLPPACINDYVFRYHRI